MTLLDILKRYIVLLRVGNADGAPSHDLPGHLKMVSTHRNTRER
jgi:hypothetical protein